ncbi:hypothetical protein F0562_034407 [Nyssa sinensis]|uniref:SOUL heme-binding protein n=1 Tax=Nyssa sinensis TaxID=561372 RepID=A0A5J5AIF2_9ASTE|nr:hypothetical protein F0562_034407 [Nyssa sinensis]
MEREGVGKMSSVGKGFGLVLLVMALSLFGLPQPCEGKGYEEPLNCKHLECAPYRVIHSLKDFEIRNYRNATWMSTPPINSSSYKDAVGRGFNILFAYVQGKNHEAAKIDMTAPVLVDIYPSTGPFCNSSFVVYFYVPKKYQKKPPASDEARPVKLPRHQYGAVRRFGGFMDDTNIATEALALKKSLRGTPWEAATAHKMGNQCALQCCRLQLTL